ncbi:hypothetical protein HZ326_3145 [Fusarium oxysporum f. sp. albedinis]|nr:hypothetical protein HZ326_3145 [Fusarium oxysporum f. sp. albedinis]
MEGKWPTKTKRLPSVETKGLVVSDLSGQASICFLSDALPLGHATCFLDSGRSHEELDRCSTQIRTSKHCSGIS